MSDIENAFDYDFHRIAYVIKSRNDELFDAYMAEGIQQSRWPRSDFDPSFYRARHEDVSKAGLHPFVHWVLFGGAEGRRTIDEAFENTVSAIVIRLPDLDRCQAAIIAISFDAAYYALTYGDVAAVGQAKIEHYLDYGWRELRNPSPSFTTRIYMSLHDTWHGYENPFVYWLLIDRHNENFDYFEDDDHCWFEEFGERFAKREIIKFRKEFDAKFYIEQYLDQSFSDEDAFHHFMSKGWRRLYNPCQTLSVGYYLKRYDDVLQARLNPLVHWIRHGRSEVRRPTPFHSELTLREFHPKVSVIILDSIDRSALALQILALKHLETVVDEILVSSQEEDSMTSDSCGIGSPTARYIMGSCRSSAFISTLQAARSEFVWVIRPNRTFSKDHLDNLLFCFRDPSVTLAFTSLSTSALAVERSNVAPAEGRKADWENFFTMPAAAWFNAMLYQNASSVDFGSYLWRRSDISSRLRQLSSELNAADSWLSYLHLASSGQVATYLESSITVRTSPAGSGCEDVGSLNDLLDFNKVVTAIKTIWDIGSIGQKAIASKLSAYPPRLASGNKSVCDWFFGTQRCLSQARTVPHVLLAFWALQHGGGETFPIMLANELYSKGLIVSLLCLETTKIDQGMYDRVHRSIPIYAAAWIDEYGADKFLRDAGVSLIHSHTVGSELQFFEAWNIKSTIPYVTTLHGSYENTDLSAEALRLIAEKTSFFIYTADKNLKALESVGLPLRGVQKLNNAMPNDLQPYPQTRQDLGIGDTAIVFTLVARGIKEKGWEPLIRAFLELRDVRPVQEVHLLLCGDGPEPQRLASIFQSEAAIKFIGFQTRIHGLLRISDVCMVPSRFVGESAPLIIIQALQCGIPVIGTRVGEIPSMLGEGTATPAGLIVERDNNDMIFQRHLFNKMLEIINCERRQQLSLAACELGKLYSISTLADDYIKIYNKVICDAHQSASVGGS